MRGNAEHGHAGRKSMDSECRRGQRWRNAMAFGDFRMEPFGVPAKRRAATVVSGDAGSAACLAELSDMYTPSTGFT